MGGVEAATLGGLHRVQEDERGSPAPDGEGVDLRVVGREREDSDAVRLQEVHHVGCWGAPQHPRRADHLGRGLRVGLAERGEVGDRQTEAFLDPVVEERGQRSGRARRRECGPGLASSTPPDALGGQLVDLRTCEDCLGIRMVRVGRPVSRPPHMMGLSETGPEPPSPRSSAGAPRSSQPSSPLRCSRRCSPWHQRRGSPTRSVPPIRGERDPAVRDPAFEVALQERLELRDSEVRHFPERLAPRKPQL